MISLESCDILISVHYTNWYFLFVLAIGMLKFISLDAKTLMSIASLFWLPTLNRTSQSSLFSSLDTDFRKWLVHVLVNTSEWHQRVFTSDFGQVISHFFVSIAILISLHRD